MIDLEHYLGGLLKNLPSGHSDKAVLEKIYGYVLQRNKESSRISFFPDTRKKLVDSGYIVYPVPGLSIRSLLLAGKPFDMESRENWINHWYLDETCRGTEVAILPKGFISSTFGKSLDYQKRSVEYDLKLYLNNKGIKGIRTMIGTPAQYAQIIFTHHEETGIDLLADFPLEKRSLNHCWTEPVSQVARSLFFVLVCSSSSARVSFRHASWEVDTSHRNVGSIPLIVPEDY